MSYAKSKASEIEGVIPYGNPNAQTHLRFKGDYKTFCGRDCEHWTASDHPVHTITHSVYTCKRCVKAYWK